jgi:regulator of replication initiation timing
MRTIEGTRYISASECAVLLGKTEGWVSQNKKNLPFNTFEDFKIDLINYDILLFQQGEETFRQKIYETKEALHQYTYKDAGLIMAKSLMDLVQFKEQADTKLEALEKTVESFTQQQAEWENENEAYQVREKEVSEQLQTTAETLEQVKTKHQTLIEASEEQKEKYEQLKTQYQETEHHYETVKEENRILIQQTEIKNVELKNFLTENESLKSRIHSAEITLENERQKLQTIGIQLNEKTTQHEVLLNKYQAIEKEQSELIKQSQDLKQNYDVSIIDYKTLGLENEGLKNKIIKLETAQQTEAKYKEEFEELKQIVMNKLGKK